MTYQIIPKTKFKSDLKRAKRRNLDLSLLTTAIDLLIVNGYLPGQYKPHALRGDFKGAMEAHIASDWILIYEIIEVEKLIILHGTGTHSDLF